MERIAAGLVGLMLVGCQQVLVTPPALPELRESALGQTLTLKGQVENWPAGRVADIALERYGEKRTVIGSVSAAGAFGVSTALQPDLSQKALNTLIVTTGPEGECRNQDLKISDAAVGGFLLPVLPLTQARAAGQSLRPQTSPVPAVPELQKRKDDSEVRWLYVDRDLRVEGTQVCSGKNVYGGRWQQATSVNVQLRAGWNQITVREERQQAGAGPSASPDVFRRTVEGGDRLAGTAWKYNGVALDR